MYSRKTNKSPPVCKGWIPWLGCAIELGKRPLDFIEEKRKELGPVYTLYVAGERLTFVTEPEDFGIFFNSTDIDFQHGVQDAVMNVGSISQENFFKYHTVLHDIVKGKLASSKLPPIADSLCTEFNKQLNSVQDECTDLHTVVRRTMYAAVMNNLFGQDVLPVSDKTEFPRLVQQFVTYDDQFEIGARLPAWWLKDWSAAKKYLLNLFDGIASNVLKAKKPAEEQTLLEAMICNVDKSCAPNYSMMLLWASLANAIPITAWALIYILGNPQVKKKLENDLNKEFGKPGTVSLLKLTEEDLAKVPYLQCCVLEAIRMHPAGIITRRVVNEFTIKDFVIPRGDMLMLSPFWAHRSSQYFPDPDTYNPDRWTDKTINTYPGFTGFGGGRYMCPGRWFALMEIQMYVLLFLYKFDTTNHDTIPNYSRKHLVGTQHPVEPFRVDLKRRESKTQTV